MLKKLFATLAIVAVPFSASQAESTMPNVLAGLDSSVQVMDEQQLNEVRGAGQNLPGYFAFREHYYNYNNYGSTNDFKSYIYDGSAIESGGIDSGAGAYVGEQWFVQIYGNYYQAEQRIKYLEQVGYDSEGQPVFGGNTAASWSDWSRSFDGFHIYQDYNIIVP